ncbi:hypothetical protein Cma02nite_17460 [Cellulomonas marina]|nr:hypothetical protein Cma02nite_17460 [Cellulomonas marina]
MRSGTGPDLLDEVPAAWRADPMLVQRRQEWLGSRVTGDGAAVVVTSPAPHRVTALGDPAAVAVLAPAALADLAPGSVAVLTVPRGTELPAAALERAGVGPSSTWDWMLTDGPAPAPPAHVAVRPLDPAADADAVRACLQEANPRSTADPLAPGTAGWWGVEGPEGTLDAVVGAERRPGPGARETWHLHGLGVRPHRRRGGLGSALTAAATRDALAAGAAFVSLGLYADNDAARRVYERLGFRTHARFASLRPVPAPGCA